MVGLADYSRNGGFVRGDVTASWRAYEPQWDRGRQFVVDRIDNAESMGMAFGTLAGEFMRTKVVPETDAVRFAQYAKAASNSMKKAESISTGEGAVAAIDLATEKLDDAEVPYEGRILFLNPTMYRYLKSGITRYTMNGENGIDYNVEIYNDMRVITVPSGRFNTVITLGQPDAHDGAGGYTAAGSTINFMVVHPSAIMQAVKLANPRIFSPEQFQQAQAWAYDFRQYHGAWVKHQKANGIYVNAPSVVSA
ncbi:MAG: hypothetical protein J6R54_02105 [Bacteroidaceae bacterium]|nr:hypothetical protein [Bacteroidaceae bacterium]